MTDTFKNLRGFSELAAFLDQLPAKIERNIARGALGAAAKPVMAAAQSMAPVGPPSGSGRRYYGGHAGALRESIRRKTRRVDGGTAVVIIAGGRKRGGADTFYAPFVEFGTKPHTITAKGYKGLSVGGLFFRSVQHPGIVNPKPFMRPAFDAQVDNAILSAGNYVKTRLATKTAFDAADVDIGIEEGA